MRRRLACALAALAATALLACGAAPPRGPGESLHVAKCGACHLRPAPERFDRAGWQAVLDRHQKRVPLDASQRANLLAYLSRMASTPPSVERAANAPAPSPSGLDPRPDAH